VNRGLTAHVDRIDLVTFSIHFVDDMTGLKSDCLGVSAGSFRYIDATYFQGDVELPREVVDTVIECQPTDHSPHPRIGQWGSITCESVQTRFQLSR
jgi:hypothetical protein